MGPADEGAAVAPAPAIRRGEAEVGPPAGGGAWGEGPALADRFINAASEDPLEVEAVSTEEERPPPLRADAEVAAAPPIGFLLDTAVTGSEAPRRWLLLLPRGAGPPPPAAAAAAEEDEAPRILKRAEAPPPSEEVDDDGRSVAGAEGLRCC